MESLQPSNITEPVGTPLPTTSLPVVDSTPQSAAGIETNQTAVPAGDRATVTEIVDGDTIGVALNGMTYRVRYIGMDTPERGDYFFSEATEANRTLVEGQEVILVKDVSETDRYGRLLRYVYLEDGTFVNAELVRPGYAVIATFPPDVRHQELFLELEREAREACWGLLAQPDGNETLPIYPSTTDVPAPTNVSQPTQANCDSAYPDVCIPPPPPDLNCVDVPYDNFTVLPPDPHGFDGDPLCQYRVGHFRLRI